MHVVYACVLEKNPFALSYAGLKLKYRDPRKCTCEQGSKVYNVLLLTRRRSLADMALELPASPNFQIVGMAPATVTLRAPGTWTARSQQSAVKWTEQILKSPLGLKLARCVRTKAFHFCLSKLVFGLCKEMPNLGFDLLLQSWTTQRQEGIFGQWKWARSENPLFLVKRSHFANIRALI